MKRQEERAALHPSHYAVVQVLLGHTLKEETERYIQKQAFRTKMRQAITRLELSYQPSYRTVLAASPHLKKVEP